MACTAVDHLVTSHPGLGAARSLVAYRNAVLRPTRALQRLIMVAMVVALGFLFEAGPLRLALWVAAGLMLAWVLAGDALVARVLWAREPARRAPEARVHEFSSSGLRERGEDAWCPWSSVVSVHADDRYWILRLVDGTPRMLERSGVDEGSTPPEQFEAYLTRHARTAVEPVHQTWSARLQRAQNGRRTYLEAHPSRVGRLIRGDRTP